METYFKFLMFSIIAETTLKPRTEFVGHNGIGAIGVIGALGECLALSAKFIQVSKSDYHGLWTGSRCPRTLLHM